MDAGITDRNLRIEVFALCEGVSDQNGRLSILGTFDSITATSFPVVLQRASVVIRFRFWPMESKNHSFRLIMSDPDGREVTAPIEASATLSPAVEDQSTAYNVILNVHSVRLENPGEHTIDFYLDRHLEGRLPFTVFHTSAPDTK